MEVPVDAFGDHFELNALTLPRQADGYAVQLLDTDCLLDKETAEFLSVRTSKLRGLFASFEAAHQAAVRWLQLSQTPLGEHEIAIVPASYDHALQRHILIYGVLRSKP